MEKLKNIISERINHRINHIHNVAEEITLYMGLKTTVEANIIKIDTLAGEMKYSCSEKTIMGDVYRFIYHYGTTLHNYGLKMKLQESYGKSTQPSTEH